MTEDLEKKLKKFKKITKSKEEKVFLSEKIDEERKELKLISGKEKAQNSFIIEDDELYFMIASEDFLSLVDNFKSLQEKIFALRLEKAILRYLPLDYHDVYSIAKLAIDKELDKGNNVEELDFARIVGTIKKEHPNLFLELPMFRN